MDKSLKPVWTPDEKISAASHMGRFMDVCARTQGTSFADYTGLYQWSISEPEAFWTEVVRYVGIEFTSPAETVLSQPGEIQTARWFEGAHLNFARHLLQGEPKSTAIIFRDERGRRREISREKLFQQVADFAAALKAAGVSKGDRIAAMLPNCPEAVVAMLASASIGAIFSSCSPDFGEQAVLDRFGQIEPRLLLVCDGYGYAGKRIDCKKKAATIARSLPDLAALVVVPFLEDQPDLSLFDQPVTFEDFLVKDSQSEFAELPFNHPLLILYSSGTTGRPKCIVHGTGGTLLQHKKELMLHTDLKPGEVIFYFTTCGWMMWNWLVSALSTGATLMLYDGSPTYPATDALLTIAAEEQVAVFGTSPRYLSALMKMTDRPSTGWPELRTMLSTGAPLQPENYDFVRDALGTHIQLSSISGGTDLISCFALGNPLLPVYRGELQSPGLGMAVKVYDPDGLSLEQGSGELVCTRPFPSMPLGFWNDHEGRYETTYFSKYPGVWAHGDVAEFTCHGGLKIHGRSDAVLNPGGVRIGTAEVCGPAMTIKEVLDAIAVAHQQAGEERILLFVVLRNNLELHEDLTQRIIEAIRTRASPRHVPARILQVVDIPRTLSGKHVELAVKSVIHGLPVENMDSIANPQALKYFRGRI